MNEKTNNEKGEPATYGPGWFRATLCRDEAPAVRLDLLAEVNALGLELAEELGIPLDIEDDGRWYITGTDVLWDPAGGSPSIAPLLERFGMGDDGCYPCQFTGELHGGIDFRVQSTLFRAYGETCSIAALKLLLVNLRNQHP